ncbi:beta-ketoacyl-ACP synthase III [Pseudoroseomonas cervicalis]|uniref:Beta-ketoacyl-[acyl-carrier-protein] synthase III n=1 Tax=Pseudoroseomonas cervicalis ATCC 49957 TaxID=525371 RepID=D5RPH8_9PROT|nr:beta-ketoacyl-ACP synthase III [Pseudoroseomonas cervicalis]EFH10773.1 beta-ketoacyl-acyl-carrier-protein synthase III [Pseudoroseomonas cervicalis ATCC 49957]
MSPRALIAGTGGYLPALVLDNDSLAARHGLDTSDAWIRERTGIRQRHLAAPGEKASDMGAAAARAALEQAGLDTSAVDGIIVATATPDAPFPSTAARVQALLGVSRGFAFDLAAACTGFVYALSVADAMIRAGQARCVLVIGAEVFSRILDWTDRGTCVLFGDGAGAVVLRAAEESEAGRGVLSCHLHADGRHGDILQVEGGLLRMAGREVFRHAVSKLASVVDEALAANGLAKSDVAWLVPHQANQRIIDAMGRKLGLPPERVVVAVDRHANTSAASIPLALAEATRDGRIARGDLVLMEGIGGGLTWGAALARF